MWRRRWLQFSLRFLFAVTVAAAAVAWWFRPGVVKPEFKLERFSNEIDAFSGKKRFYAHVRLTNSGPDSIVLHKNKDYIIDVQPLFGEVDEDGWQAVNGRIFVSESGTKPTRLSPQQFNVFVISMEKDVRTIKLGVFVSDRRNQRQKMYWSPPFSIPDDVFSEQTP